MISVPLTLEFGYLIIFLVLLIALLSLCPIIALLISFGNSLYLFSGGMELLFQNRKSIKINVPVLEGAGLKIRQLLPYIRDEVKPDRPELFMQEDTIRPGVLILINENDWELEGGLDAELNPNDSILFISTLHGG